MRAHANGDINRPRLDRAGTRHLQTLWTLGAVGGMTDAELLARFVAGTKRSDETDAAELAFAALVDRHGGTVLRVARTVLGDESASLDASQATFLLLAQKARRLHVEDSLAPWLASVARRVALGVRKAEARRHRHETAAAAARPESTLNPRAEVWNETIRGILAEVDRLPEPYRAAVVACHLDGLTQHAAADRLGWPLGTLQSRLDRGRRRLRDRLTRRGLAPSTLGLIPKSGLPAIFPSSLTPPLARAAVAWALQASPSALPLAPGVVAILHPTLKGTIVLKLSAAAFTLTTALGIAATGLGLGGDTPSPVPALAMRQGSSPATTPPGLAPAPRGDDGGGPPRPAPPDLLSTPVPTPAPPVTPDDSVIPSPGPPADAPAVPPRGGVVPSPADASSPPAPRSITPATESPATTPPVPAPIRRRPPGGVPQLPPPDDQLPALAPVPTPASPVSPDDSVIPSRNPFNDAFLVPPPGGVDRLPADAPPIPAPRPITPAIEEPLPPPIEGPDLTTLLCFVLDEDGLFPLVRMGNDTSYYKLAELKYPIRVLSRTRAFERDIAERFQVSDIPTYLIVNGSGQVAVRLTDFQSTKELAKLYNDYQRRLINERQEAESNSVPPPPKPCDLTLLCFTSDGSSPCQEMKPRVELLAAQGYPVQRIDIKQQPGLAQRFKIQAVPSYVLTNVFGQAVSDATGLISAARLASLFHKNQPLALVDQNDRPDPASDTVVPGPSLFHKNLSRALVDRIDQPDPASDTVVPDPTPEPKLTIPLRYPQPWETAVRVKVKLSDKEWEFASGTVIASTPAESFILGCAHTFRDGLDNLKQPTRQTRAIGVDLFGGQFEGEPSHLRRVESDLPAEVVAVDLKSDLALIRIRPGKILPVAPIIARGWSLGPGMKLITTGCSHGEDVTAWDTEILLPVTKMNDSEGRSFAMIKCKHQPAEGRSGGGLFTRDGYLVGICGYADPNEHVGLYRGPATFADLNKILKRTGDEVTLDLAKLATALPEMKLLGISILRDPAAAAASPSRFSDRPSLTAPDNQRLDALERKLDAILDGMNQNQNQRTPARRPRIAPLIPDRRRADPGRLEPALPAPGERPAPVAPPTEDEFVPETRINEDGMEYAVTRRNPRIVHPVPDEAMIVPPEPILTPPVSDQERRLRDLERKLDRVLESLDNIRGQMNEKPGTSSR